MHRRQARKIGIDAPEIITTRSAPDPRQFWACDAVFQLWDSWAADAIVEDRERGVYTRG